MVGSLFTQVFCSQPNGVSLCGRPCRRTSANELPDPHFEIKQFAFRVASSSAHLPLEEPLLGKALDANGNSYRSVRPAPVEDPHTVLPCLPESTAGEGPPPEGAKPFAWCSAGWLAFIGWRTGILAACRVRQRSLTICFVPPSMRSRNSLASPRTE